MIALDLASYREIVQEASVLQASGTVARVTGLLIEADGPATRLGGLCEIFPSSGDEPIRAEVVGFREHKILLMPFSSSLGIGPGDRITAMQSVGTVRVGPQLLGRVINGFGNVIDGGEELSCREEALLHTLPLNPLSRKRIREPLDLGIRALNGLLTCGKGQRLGILAGSGVGKSILLGMIARYTRAEINVIALIGERGREVREFIEKDLGPEGLKRSVVVVATSDQSPLLRIRAAYAATAIAEYFRDRGRDVNLMMDSVTRFAMAQREIGLAVGEPPTTKGYTPSVFALLPKLLERAGTCSGKGTITGLYTVLVEGDDMNEPIADATRAILDGHIVLSRALAAQDHYPAIDVLSSKSRVMIDVVDPEHRALANRMIATLATYKNAEDLINIGAYVSGSNPKIDEAIGKIDAIQAYLQQGIGEQVVLDESVAGLRKIFT
ncbi:MAG: flagellar protein export ATPase FliI [Deltaproteobacteria bacterium]|nr:flagellar protein export ATPase FliI [Deltaproteobacteria bacterium]